MKDILISVHPQWVEKIANGEKTIEVRKTVPKIKTPFKCYIYCTKGNGQNGDCLVSSGIQCGRVIGEFICDRMVVKSQNYGTNGNTLYGWHISDLKIYDKPKELSEFGCVCLWAKYVESAPYCGWFCCDYECGVDCKYFDCPLCGGESCEYEDFAYCMCKGLQPLNKPPVSWCYVKEKVDV